MAVDPRVLELLRRWEEHREGAEALSPEDLCADSPELLEEVKRRIQDLQALEPVLETPKDGEQPGPSRRSDGAGSATAESAAAAGRYRPVQFHAKGGLGEVHRAEDAELHREVALKRIQARYANDPASRRRFLLEAEITARLEHPGIVPVHGMIVDDDGQPCYAMRFIEGPTLGDAIQEFHEADKKPGRDPGERSLALRKLLGHFITVCNTIAYAHSRGIIHRDLKPGNIMLGRYGERLVVDWGLAKPFARTDTERASGEQTLAVTSEASPEGATVPGQARGTPAFMSPEQAEGRLDEMGPASDIFSLGATLYALLTGQAPYPGDMYKALQKARRADFSPPRAAKRDVARALEAICLRAMALKPEERYATAKEMADDIESWLADEPVRAYGEPWPVKAGRWARKHKPLVSGAAAAILVGVVALTAGLFWYQSEQNRRAAEIALRQQEAERKQALAESAVRVALSQAETAQQDLHAILERPGGVFELLNRPENWQARINLAEAALDRARALAKAETGLDPKLGAAADNLQAALRQDEDDRRLAVRLEKIRMDTAAVVEGAFDYAGAAREYPKAFAEVGLAIPEGETEALATRIRSSRIKEHFVAALDDWAYAAYRVGTEELAEKVLATARRAAPDPAWGDRLRHLKLWRDPNALAMLIKDARPNGLSPQTLTLWAFYSVRIALFSKAGCGTLRLSTPLISG